MQPNFKPSRHQVSLGFSDAAVDMIIDEDDENRRDGVGNKKDWHMDMRKRKSVQDASNDMLKDRRRSALLVP